MIRRDANAKDYEARVEEVIANPTPPMVKGMPRYRRTKSSNVNIIIP